MQKFNKFYININFKKASLEVYKYLLKFPGNLQQFSKYFRVSGVLSGIFKNYRQNVKKIPTYANIFKIFQISYVKQVLKRIFKFLLSYFQNSIFNFLKRFCRSVLFNLTVKYVILKRILLDFFNKNSLIRMQFTSNLLNTFKRDKNVLFFPKLKNTAFKFHKNSLKLIKKSF